MQVCWKRIHPNSDHPLGHFQWYRACRVQGFWLNSVINKVQRFSFVDRKNSLQCVRNSILWSKHWVFINSAGTNWEAQLYLHLVEGPNLLSGSIHTLQTWLCADIVQFWPLSLCHATPRERVQGQQFAHVSSRGFAWHRERGQNCADHVLHTVRELKQRRGRKQWKRH